MNVQQSTLDLLHRIQDTPHLTARLRILQAALDRANVPPAIVKRREQRRELAHADQSRS